MTILDLASQRAAREVRASNETAREAARREETIALGITADTHRRLLKFVADVENGKIVDEMFNMNSWCGSACCIGGHIFMVDAWQEFEVEALYTLFYPIGGAIHCRIARHGATAVRRFLAGRTKDPWDFPMTQEET